RQWAATTGEGWPVAAAAHHIAVGHESLPGMVSAVAAGNTLPPFTMADLDAGNAAHAARFADASRPETPAIARAGGDKAAAAVRGFSDEQLARTGPLPMGEFSLAENITHILVGHVLQHSGSVRAAIGA